MPASPRRHVGQVSVGAQKTTQNKRISGSTAQYKGDTRNTVVSDPSVYVIFLGPNGDPS